jgi:hypothetical protein
MTKTRAITPDDALALVQGLRDFLRARPHWKLTDVVKASAIPEGTMRDWLNNGRRPKGLANLQALQRFLKEYNHDN